MFCSIYSSHLKWLGFDTRKWSPFPLFPFQQHSLRLGTWSSPPPSLLSTEGSVIRRFPRLSLHTVISYISHMEPVTVIKNEGAIDGMTVESTFHAGTRQYGFAQTKGSGILLNRGYIHWQSSILYIAIFYFHSILQRAFHTLHDPRNGHTAILLV